MEIKKNKTKIEKKYKDSDLLNAAYNFSKDKHHIDKTFLYSLIEFQKVWGGITDKQRYCLMKFIRKYKINIDKWLL